MATVFGRLRRLEEVAHQRVARVDADATSRLKPVRHRSRTLIEAGPGELNRAGRPIGREWDRYLRGEEGYISLGRSAVRHWPVLAIAILLGSLFGTGAGGVVSPTYTAR